MPWTLVTSLSENVSQFTTTFTDSDRDNTVSLGDRSIGDIVDITCNFPTGVVTDYFGFNGGSLGDIDVVHIAPDIANNNITVRLRMTENSLNFGRFNIAFDFDESTPNYTVRMIHV